MLANHLVDLGHTSVACITGPLNIALSRERLRGFEETLRERGVLLRKNWIIEENFQFEGGSIAVKRLLSETDF